jgi:hypothetical protein
MDVEIRLLPCFDIIMLQYVRLFLDQLVFILLKYNNFLI